MYAYIHVLLYHAILCYIIHSRTQASSRFTSGQVRQMRRIMSPSCFLGTEPGSEFNLNPKTLKP